MLPDEPTQNTGGWVLHPWLWALEVPPAYLGGSCLPRSLYPWGCCSPVISVSLGLAAKTLIRADAPDSSASAHCHWPWSLSASTPMSQGKACHSLPATRSWKLDRGPREL